MSLDRSVLAFAGVMVLVSVALTSFGVAAFRLVHGLHRPEPAAVGLHRLLPGRYDLPLVRRQAGLRVLTAR